MVWLSHWTFGNELEGGDEVNISISIGGDEFQVKECGIEFVYDDDDEQKKRTKLTLLEFVYDDDEQKKKRTKVTHNISFSCEQVIDGELFRGTVNSHLLKRWGLSSSEDGKKLSDNDMGIEFRHSMGKVYFAGRIISMAAF
ncbi:hypothetical protein F0562_020085 [Nyssa sinensis]|uniref:Uncharacterized protein n=1 Tax=Nyssa sinensis TaxID=561372 RepID=A0A5J5BVJ3_9ASTE|nr:hypothetical protein F0562_020085 [Nyssa sinensis]